MALLYVVVLIAKSLLMAITTNAAFVGVRTTYVFLKAVELLTSQNCHFQPVIIRAH